MNCVLWMRPACVALIGLIGWQASAQAEDESEQTPASAQAFLMSAVKDWARLSTDRLEVHYGIRSVNSQKADCETEIIHNGGTTVIKWKAAGTITPIDIGKGSYRYLLKIQQPPKGYVQLYFSSDDIWRRALIAAEFLKASCREGAF